jgi:septal ring factor EnvC (AmiA/AmiB activator)
MIERPKRSVTRFFVPLIDVLILLFCIFLLMPFVASSSDAEPDTKVKTKAVEPELPKDVTELRAQLEKARDEIQRLKTERGNLAERLSVKVLEIDAKDGRLSYLKDGQRVFVTKQEEAVEVVTVHKRASGTKEPFFLILYPRQKSGYPEQQQADDYARWFKGVQFQFDRPFAP